MKGSPSYPFIPERILVTGGAGFLGRYIAEALARAGRTVSVLDNLSVVGSDFACRPLQSPRITCILGSVCDQALISDLVRSHDGVIHLASVVGVEHTMLNRIPTMLNLTGTIWLGEALTTSHTVLFGSSADVYGLHSRLYDRPMGEDDLNVYEAGDVDRWVYPRVKALEENVIARSAARAVNVRIFNAYGPYMDWGCPKRVIPRFIRNALAGETLRISGDGAQRRAFCHYTDTVRGILAAFDYAAAQQESASTVFNIGNTDACSILEVAELVIQLGLELGLIDQPPSIELHAELYQQSFDDTWHRVPDITRARTLLGFVPAVSFPEGLRRTLLEFARLTSEAQVRQAQALDL